MDIACSPGIFLKGNAAKGNGPLRCAERAVDPGICSDVNDQSTRGSPARDSVMGAMREVMKINIARWQAHVAAKTSPFA
jgi:hypothetical protein